MTRNDKQILIRINKEDLEHYQKESQRLELKTQDLIRYILKKHKQDTTKL